MAKANDTEIGQVQIKGLTVKQFITIIVLLCSFIFSVAVIYTNIKSDIKDVQKSQSETQSRLELLDKKTETIQINQQRTEVWQGRIEEKITDKAK